MFWFQHCTKSSLKMEKLKKCKDDIPFSLYISVYICKKQSLASIRTIIKIMQLTLLQYLIYRPIAKFANFDQQIPYMPLF